jgi:hypothetical protein
MERSSHTDSYDIPDLRFHVLHHYKDNVGIIEAVKSQDNSVTYHLVHLVPKSDFHTPKYYSYIDLFIELSKKFRGAYHSLKDNVIVKLSDTQTSSRKNLSHHR